MPFFTCPSCRLSHFAPVARPSLDSHCPRCSEAEGTKVRLIETTTLAEAREAQPLAHPGGDDFRRSA